eukprot:349956-Chlamydomonas_euryale.AAC.3
MGEESGYSTLEGDGGGQTLQAGVVGGQTILGRPREGERMAWDGVEKGRELLGRRGERRELLGWQKAGHELPS